MLIDASSLIISLQAYRLFKKELEESCNYTMKKKLNDTYHISRNDSNAMSRVLNSIDARCDCDISLSWLIQCRHKICLKRSFDIKDFDVRHHYRESSEINLGKQVENNKPYNFNIDDSDNSTINKDDFDVGNIELSDIDNKVNTLPISVDMGLPIQHTVNYKLSNASSIKYSTSHNGCLSVQELMKLQSETAAKYNSCSIDVKMFICGSLIKIKDVATKGGGNKDEFLTDEVNNDLSSQMKSIIGNYNNSFAHKNNSFMGGQNDQSKFKVNKCSQNMIRGQPKKRLKSVVEQHKLSASRRKKKPKLSTLEPKPSDNGIIVRNRMEGCRKCSFCKQPQHNLSNCPKRNNLLVLCRSREYKNSVQKSTFLEEMKSGPRSQLDLNYSSLQVMEGLFSSRKPHHIIVHTSYPKQNQSRSQTVWSLGALLFSVSLVANTGDVDDCYSNCIVDGIELEIFISRNINSDSKYIYDAAGYINRNNISSIQTVTGRGLSQDPPEEGQYNVDI